MVYRYREHSELKEQAKAGWRGRERKEREVGRRGRRKRERERTSEQLILSFAVLTQDNRWR